MKRENSWESVLETADSKNMPIYLIFTVRNSCVNPKSRYILKMKIKKGNFGGPVCDYEIDPQVNGIFQTISWLKITFHLKYLEKSSWKGFFLVLTLRIKFDQCPNVRARSPQVLARGITKTLLSVSINFGPFVNYFLLIQGLIPQSKHHKVVSNCRDTVCPCRITLVTDFGPADTNLAW